MHLFQFTTVASLLALSSRAVAGVVDTTQVADIKARALGINCEGSFFCYKGAMQNIVSTALSNTGGCSAAPGQQMYCDGNICAFTQGTNDYINPELAQHLLTALQAHGCQGCGSVPLSYPFSNDPSGGILTVNYVSDNHGCNGICIPQC